MSQVQQIARVVHSKFLTFGVYVKRLRMLGTSALVSVR
jgi:hypothetical protein